MKQAMPQLVFLLTFLLAGGGCGQRAAEDHHPEFITAPGAYKLYDGEVEVEVAETPGGLRFKVLHHRNGYLSNEDVIEKGAKWFVYVGSPHESWVFTGKELVHTKVTGSTTVARSSILAPEIVQQAPARVQERLPEAFKANFAGPKAEDGSATQ